MLNTGGIDSFTGFSPSERSSSRAKGVEDMGSQDFLALMIAQMENQDPTQPMDQLAFMSQLAQFGTVSGVQELNMAMSDLATSVTGSQAIQASNLIGRSVATESNTGHLAIAGNDEAGNTVLAMRASVDVGPGASGGRFYVHNVQGTLSFRAIYRPEVVSFLLCGMESTLRVTSCLQGSTKSRPKPIWAIEHNQPEFMATTELYRSQLVPAMPSH